jgi:hypothetical protein
MKGTEQSFTPPRFFSYTTMLQEETRMSHLVDPARIRFSEHALQRMWAQSLSVHAVLEALQVSEVIEDYADAIRGSCALALGVVDKRALHIVAAYDAHGYHLIITAYLPDPTRWSADFRQRLPLTSQGE